MNELAAHLVHLRRRNLSPDTIEQRRYCIERTVAGLGPVSIFDATADQLAAIIDRRDLTAKSQYGWISHLHMFYAWAIREELTTTDPTVKLDRPRLPRYCPRPISDADLHLAITSADGTVRAWLTLAAYAGMRCAEIGQLEASDVMIDDGLIRVFGKGRRERIIPLHPSIVAELRKIDMPKSGPIWRNTQDNPYRPCRVSQILCAHLKACGIDATAHQLRHWFGSRLYRGTCDLRLTQEVMGHSSPTTTAVYAAFSQRKAREAVAAL